MPPSVRASASFAAVRSARPPAHALASPPPSPPSDLALTNDPLRWRFQWWSRPVPWFRQNHGGACDVAASVGEQPLVSRDATTATRCNASLDTKSAADHTLVPPSTLVALGRKRAAAARRFLPRRRLFRGARGESSGLFRGARGESSGLFRRRLFRGASGLHTWRGDVDVSRLVSRMARCRGSGAGVARWFRAELKRGLVRVRVRVS